MNEVIAHTIGSFWYCMGCVSALGTDEDASPVTADQLIDDESYFCDSCGDPVRRLA